MEGSASFFGKGKAPDARPGKMWQDPLLGYFETHGKMKFKEGESYGLTDHQKKAVMERYRIKELLKLEYLKKEFNPATRAYHGGIIVDPAVFRWYAADMAHAEVFKMTPKSFTFILLLTIVPLAILTKKVFAEGLIYDKMCKKGRFLWWDREERFVATGGTGKLGNYFPYF